MTSSLARSQKGTLEDSAPQTDVQRYSSVLRFSSRLKNSTPVQARLRRLRAFGERVEDVIGTAGSLRRLLRTIDLEPFALTSPSVRGNGDDLVDAIARATEQAYYGELGMTRRRLAREAEPHPAEPVWPLVESSLRRLTGETSIGARSFSLREIDEIAASRSDAASFVTMHEAGEVAAGRMPCDSERDFEETLESSFPSGRPVLITYRTWTGRYRWVHGGDYERVASAIRYANRNSRSPRVLATWYQRSIDVGAVRSLERSVRGFLLRDDRLDPYAYNRLSELGVAFQLLTIRLGVRTRDILLVVPETKRDRMVAIALTAKLPVPSGELTATLQRAAAAQRFLTT